MEVEKGPNWRGRLLVGAVMALVLSNGALAFFLVETRDELEQQEARQSSAVSSQEQLREDVTEVLGALASNAGSGQRSLAEVESALDDLERTLLGFDRRTGSSDVIGKVESEIETVRGEVEDVRSCVNRLVSALSLDSSFLPRC